MGLVQYPEVVAVRHGAALEIKPENRDAILERQDLVTPNTNLASTVAYCLDVFAEPLPAV